MIDHVAQRSLNLLLAVAVLALAQGRCLTEVDWIDEVVFPEDYAVDQKEKSESAQRRKEYQAEEARKRAQQQAEAAVPQGEFGPPINVGVPPVHPPAITSIEFPSSIPGDGLTYHGKLHFTDAGGDINRITIEVVHAIDFAGADYDASQYIISGSEYSGVTDLYIWCDGQQAVTLRTTLYDAGGSRSNSMDFSFNCT